MQPDVGASIDAPSIANGRYRLLAELSATEVFTVWRVRDSLVDCERVIKVLATGMAAKAKVRQRFESEAHAMARLSHPNIAMVHDVGTEAGRPYVVVELLEGGSVAAWLQRNGAMPARVAADVMILVLEALQQAHRDGLAHRDLTPRHVLLSATGVPKVTDFGFGPLRVLGGAIDGPASVYQSPEQRLGAAGGVPSDVFAAGVSLLVMLTGREPASLTESAWSELPVDLVDVFRKATQEDPSLRWESALQMGLALRAALPALEPVPDTTPPLGQLVAHHATPSERVADPSEPEWTLRPVRAKATALDDRGTVPNAPTREVSSRRTSTIEPVGSAVRSSMNSFNTFSLPLVEIPDEAPPAPLVVEAAPPPPPAPARVAAEPKPVAAPIAQVAPAADERSLQGFAFAAIALALAGGTLLVAYTLFG